MKILIFFILLLSILLNPIVLFAADNQSINYGGKTLQLGQTYADGPEAFDRRSVFPNILFAAIGVLIILFIIINLIRYLEYRKIR
ncbi:hypothetical protein KKA15_02355 [Patescibacteria group bacterium]|nr:hypothetical protein [Patescibacteria group bacterium]